MKEIRLFTLLRISVAICLAAVFFSCDRFAQQQDQLALADVMNAAYLGIRLTEMSTDAPTEFVKVIRNDPEKEICAVDFLDEEGSVLKDAFIKFQLYAITEISPGYSVLSGEFRYEIMGNEQFTFELLLCNNTGKLYDLQRNFSHEDANYYHGAEFFQVDGDGNVYFRNGSVRRLVIRGNEIGVETYVDMPDDNYWGWFYVDSCANVYFNHGTKLKLSGGGIVPTGAQFLPFAGMDGHTYAWECDDDAVPGIYKLDVGGDVLYKTLVLPVNFHPRPWDEYRCISYYPDSASYGHVFIMPYNTGPGELGYIWDEKENRLLSLLFPEQIPAQVNILNLQGPYLWLYDFYQHPHELYLANLETIASEQGSDLAIIEECRCFTLPVDYQVLEMTFDIVRKRVEFLAYDESLESKVWGEVHPHDGVTSWVENSGLLYTRLTEIN